MEAFTNLCFQKCFCNFNDIGWGSSSHLKWFFFALLMRTAVILSVTPQTNVRHIKQTHATWKKTYFCTCRILANSFLLDQRNYNEQMATGIWAEDFCITLTLEVRENLFLNVSLSF